MAALNDLWICPACKRSFANRNQSHACGRHELAAHFEGRPAELRSIYDAFVAMLRQFGPVEVLPEKTRIAFHVRMSFAQLTIRKGWVDGHFVLASRHESPLFTRVETLSPRNHVHVFRLHTKDKVNSLRPYAELAYRVGRQDHRADRAARRS